jgi:hypothetical protein
VERLFLVSSPGSPFYANIVAADRFQRTRRGGIPGIRTDDRDGRAVDWMKGPPPPGRLPELHQRCLGRSSGRT